MSMTEKKIRQRSKLKKRYKTPILIRFGSIGRLTSGGSGVKTENRPNQRNRRP